ncbi:DDE-type integrase/transposase/recombinase [Maribacter sp. ANRC-HE7]|uniref:DDE-type integrase/transposase/recombinase n=1 Tax=Maribacter aquimaris TaxID=2737171 RepID=A0ABR7UWP4_9FLAO|nr:DDE-type integrase/transposase/recombinase [Maribacter aquimaris]MBD0776954.1 DDE-type integrase/transposase/recombinase [Maribacter aquimaris]
MVFKDVSPNLLTQEGIRGDEETVPNDHMLISMFTRSLAGASDNTVCYYSSRVNEMGSHASQLVKRFAYSVRYPYLLKDLKIERPDQLWHTDITYIPKLRGFMYMNAIIDVHSRKILNWSISNSMDKEWCIDLLEDTIAKYGAPEIHNSDQRSQYTSTQYIDVLK